VHKIDTLYNKKALRKSMAAFCGGEKGCDFGFVDLIFSSDILQLRFNLFAGAYLYVETPGARE